MSEYSKGPWRVEGTMNPAVHLPDGSVWTELRPAKYTRESFGEKPHENAQRNAAHIVACVNAHAGLVNVNQALKLALMELMNHVEADPRDDHCWVCGTLLASDYPAAEGQHLPNCAWESARAALANTEVK